MSGSCPVNRTALPSTAPAVSTPKPAAVAFAEQDAAYRDSVLPPSVRARVAVEAASPLGWDRWIGPDGAFLGMTTFGESGPAEDVYEHFGITAEKAAELGRKALDGVGTRS